ncbi:MAG: hypothetical protein IPP25_07715 [Saprospiraceae bacterium]|nr:hypothetical protein [Candidatus Opimibacter skivensis]
MPRDANGCTRTAAVDVSTEDLVSPFYHSRLRIFSIECDADTSRIGTGTAIASDDVILHRQSHLVMQRLRIMHAGLHE